MADSVTVAVALCTHNGERYLEDQLRSIMGQTRMVDQVVISDDASTDDTMSVVNQFARGAGDQSDIRVGENRPALGVTANFASALARTTADVVLLSDQDDVWHRDKVSILVSRLNRARPQLVFTDATIVDGAGRETGEMLFSNLRISPYELGEVEAGDALGVLLRRNIVTGATAAVTRPLIETALPIPESWVHDEWLAITAAVRGDLIVEPRPLTSYRLHGANEIGASRLGLRAAFGRLSEPRRDRNRRLLERAAALAERFGDDQDLRPAVREAVRGKLQHEQARASYPVARLRRIRPVFAQWRSGSYRRFGLGLRDVLRDLVQPG